MRPATRNNPVATASSRPQTCKSYSPFNPTQIRPPSSVFSYGQSRRLDSAVFAPTPPGTSGQNGLRNNLVLNPPPTVPITRTIHQIGQSRQSNNLHCGPPAVAATTCRESNPYPPKTAYSRPQYLQYPPLPPAAYLQTPGPFPQIPGSAYTQQSKPYPQAPPTSFSQKQNSPYQSLPQTASPQYQQYPPTAPATFILPPVSANNNYWWPPQEQPTTFQGSPFTEQQKIPGDFSPLSNNFGPPPTTPAFNATETLHATPQENNPYLPLPGFINSAYPPYISPTSFNNCSFHYSGIPDPNSNPLWTSDRRHQRGYKVNRSAGDDQMARVPNTTKDSLRIGKMKFGNNERCLARQDGCKKYGDCKRCGDGKGDTSERMSRRDKFLAMKRNGVVNTTTNVLNIQCELKVSDRQLLKQRLVEGKTFEGNKLSPHLNPKRSKRTKEMQVQTSKILLAPVRKCSKMTGTSNVDTGLSPAAERDRIDLLKLIAEEETKLREWTYARNTKRRTENFQGDEHFGNLGGQKINATSRNENLRRSASRPIELLDKVAHRVLSDEIEASKSDLEEIFAQKDSPRSSCSSIENDNTRDRRFSTIDIRSRRSVGRQVQRAVSVSVVNKSRQRFSRKSYRRARSQYDPRSKIRRRIAKLLLRNETDVDSDMEDLKEFCVMPVICIRNCSPSPCCRPTCNPCCSPCRPCTPTRVTIWQTFPYKCTPSCCTTGCEPCCPAPCCPAPCCPSPPPCCPQPCCPATCCPPPCCIPCCQPCCPSPCCNPCCKPCCPPPCPPRSCCSCPPPPPCPPPNRPTCCSPPPCPPRCCSNQRCRSCSPCGSCCQDSCSPSGSCCRTTRSCSPCSLCPPCYKPCKPCRPLPSPPCWRPCQPCSNPCCPPQPPCCPPRPCCPKPKCCVPCNPCCRPRCPTPCCDQPCCQPCSPPCPPPCCPAPCCPPPCCPAPCCPPPCCPAPCCPKPCCPMQCCPKPCCPPPCCPKSRCCKPRCCSPRCSPPPCCPPPFPPPCCPPPCCSPPPCSSPRRRCCPRPCPPPCYCCPRPCSPNPPRNNNCCSRSCSPCCPPPPRPPPCVPRRSMCCRPPSSDAGGPCCPCPMPCPPCCSPCPVKRCCRRRRKRRGCCCCCPEPPLPQSAIVRYCPCPANCICPTSCPCPCMPSQGCC